MHMSTHVCDVHRQRITQTEPKEHLIVHNHRNYKVFYPIILFFSHFIKRVSVGSQGFLFVLFLFVWYKELIFSFHTEKQLLEVRITSEPQIARLLI